MLKLARGRVVSFDLRKKFGFVAIDGTDAEAFLHISVLKDAGLVSVPIGTMLTFEFEPDARRRIARIVEADMSTALPGQPLPLYRKTKHDPGRMVPNESEADTPPLPPCARCKVAYRLVGIEGAEKLHHDLYTFECSGCGHIETRTVRVS